MSNLPDFIPYGNTTIRAITMNGVTKFVARDLCKLLGYPRADKMLDPFVTTVPEYVSFMTPGGTQSIRVVAREDMDTVLAHCRHKNVASVRHWLHHHARRTARGFVAVGVILEQEP